MPRSLLSVLLLLPLLLVALSSAEVVWSWNVDSTGVSGIVADGLDSNAIAAQCGLLQQGLRMWAGSDW